MTTHGAIRTRLMEDAAVAALVGTRIYPQRLPQNVTFPAVTYARVGGGLRSDHSPGVFGPERWQVNAWGADYNSSVALSEAIIRALHGWRSQSEGIDRALFIVSIDLQEAETNRYYRATDFTIWATAPVPA